MGERLEAGYALYCLAIDVERQDKESILFEW